MKHLKFFVCLFLAMGMILMFPASQASAQVKKPDCTPQPQAKPYPQDPIAMSTVQTVPNMEPRFVHKVQEDEAKAKLKKFGKRPNVIVFLLDDVGWGDIGCFGGGTAIGSPTPQMDTLAREGLRLTSTYAQPSCSPTRATIMTGRLPMRHGILTPPMYGDAGGLQGEITVAELLKKAGYVTQAVGKWHIGENTESQPQNVGFDDFYGFLSVSDMYTEWRDPYFYPEVVNHRERYSWACNQDFNHFLVHGIGPKGSQTTGELINVKEITIDVSKQLDDMWADYSVDFIKKQKGSDKPFFLYHGTRGCHFDNYPSDSVAGTTPAAYPYRDCISQMDAILGRLIQTLRETGQLENTLIFITSDNGPEMETWWDSGYTPFRGAKGSTWEGGMRVPGIAYWKGMIKAGRESDGLFDLADLFNTALTLANVDLTNTSNIPSTTYIDGIDQTSFLLSDTGLSNRKYVYYWLTNAFSGIRSGEYKYMLTGTYSEYLGDTWNAGGLSGALTRFAYSKLFNLYLDPKETRDFFIRKVVYEHYFKSAASAHLTSMTTYPAKVSISPLSTLPVETNN